MNATTTLKTLGELKVALKTAKAVYVWCNWQRDEGAYFEIPKSKFLRSIGADVPSEGAHGGPDDGSHADFRIEDGSIYVN